MKNTVKTNRPTDQVIDLKNIHVVSNTRTSFDEKDILELAESIKSNGLLQPIGVLKTDKNNFRIIFGERRYRAHLVNKAQNINCKVFEDLTEQQITEIQIIENLQRKDIHPMEEAKAFNTMIENQKITFKEVGLKVGKSASFVAQRLKLNDLIDVFQTAFTANRFNISTALEIAILSKESQQGLWDDECEHLDVEDEIEISNHDLNRFKLNLKNASFDIKDKKLIPSVGACTNCQFNTACQSVLFPDEAKTASCTNAPCYQDKTKLSFEKLIKEALAEPGTELVSTSYNGLSEFAKSLVEQGYKVLGNSEIEEYEQSEKPNLEDYQERLNDEDFENEAEMMEEFNADMKTYNDEMAHYNSLKDSGKIKRGFVVCGSSKGQFIDYIISERVEGSNNNFVKQTAKVLQEKIKSQTVTADDYTAEIERLKMAENRKRELDEEKVQPLFYDVLKEDVLFNNNPETLEKEELGAMIILMLEFGGYQLWSMCESFIDGGKNTVDLLMLFNTKSVDELNLILNKLMRLVMVLKLKPNQGDRPSKNVKALALVQIATHYRPDKIQEVWENQLVERNKRETVLNQKINSFEAKKLDIAPIEKVA